MTVIVKEVLQVCHSYDPPFLDIARQYATALRLLGFSVTTVYVKGDPSDRVLDGSASDKVIFLKNNSKDIRGLKLKQINQLKKVCEKKSYSFIVAHRFKSIFISNHIKEIPVIGVHHCFGDYKRFTRRWHIYLNRKKITLLGVSNAIRDDISNSLTSFPKNKIHTLYNRVNYLALSNSQKDKSEAREYLNLPKSTYIYGNVGRLHKDKDQKTLIEAFEKVLQQTPDAILVIIGTGELEGELKKLAKSLSIEKNVLFLGKVANAYQYFKAFDSFVLTSDREPFGMVLLEAMTAGIPIAITDCGGAPEVVGNTALKFSFGDSKEASESMLQLRKINKHEIETIAQAMKVRIEKEFSDQAASIKLKCILESLSLI